MKFTVKRPSLLVCITYYEKSNNDNVYPSLFLLPQALPVQTSAPIARNGVIHPPTADCLYCHYIRPTITTFVTLSQHDIVPTNLDTLPLLATMSMMRPHEGKQNNAAVQFSKKRGTTKDNNNNNLRN